MTTNMVSWVAEYVQNKFQRAKQLGVVASFFSFFQGRATTFAIVFAVIGIVGWFKGRDMAGYALFVGSIQSFVFAHSCKEDWCDYKNRELSQTPDPTSTVVTSVKVS